MLDSLVIFAPPFEGVLSFEASIIKDVITGLA